MISRTGVWQKAHSFCEPGARRTFAVFDPIFLNCMFLQYFVAAATVDVPFHSNKARFVQLQKMEMVPQSKVRVSQVAKTSFGRTVPRILQLLICAMLFVVAPAWAKEHPVPLDKNVDSAKCLECHNSDDNREFGGTGANGPHGSKWSHLLERRYEFSQAPAPGGLITNLYPNPDVTVNGPYAMCGKCHDLPNNILANTSWNQHALHVSQYGFSCSVCHTSHGMGAISPTFTGERLVNFDANVVAPNGVSPIGYNRSLNTCTLTCHNVTHNSNGTVTAAVAGRLR